MKAADHETFAARGGAGVDSGTMTGDAGPFAISSGASADVAAGVTATGVCAAGISTVHAGPTNDTTGSRSTLTSAIVHTKWRVAADALRKTTSCMIAAIPRSAVVLTTDRESDE